MDDAAGADQVRRWWRRWPDANVGVVTGAVSGLVVLDVDPRHGGDESLAVLEGIHGTLPRTVESLTGGGGQHLYFRHPGTVVPSRSIAPGLDIKGDGGLVVSPPSQHISGRVYRWEPGCAPGEVPLADLPRWLEAVVQDPSLSPSGAGRVARQVPVRTEGDRAEFAALWAQAGVELRSGDRYYRCPFHPDHHPSLHIDADGCRFYCFGCGRGGGSGRLRRLVSRPRRSVSTGAGPGDPSALEPTATVTLPGTTEVHVVGDAAYQDVLLELTGGRRHYGGVRMETVACLVPGPGGPDHPASVTVAIAGRTVGYLSGPDAAHLGSEIAAAIERSGQATCAAVIVGGWEREHGDIGFFGVRLRTGASPGTAGSPVDPRRRGGDHRP
jgi:hypothetical protein